MNVRDIPRLFNAAAHFVDRNVLEGRGARVAYECGDERVTYADLLDRVNRAGNALRALDVRVEERVVLLLLDTPAFPYCFFGGIKIGAVPVPVNTLLKPHDWEFILNDTRARVMIVSDSLLPKLLEIPRERLRYLKHILVAGSMPARLSCGTGDVIEKLGWLEAMMASASPQLEAEPTCKDDAAFWLYSSGSTGTPKGCVHLQHDMVVCAERYARQTLGIREDDRFFSVAKLFFAYGLGNAGYFPLAVGATSILFPGPPTPANVFAQIERYKPTLFFSVPSNFAALLSHHREGGGEFELDSVRYAVSAGESLPAAIFERFRQRFGVEILDAIGSSECLHMFIANRLGAARAGSSGQIIDGFEARILDENGQPVPAGQVGNLFIRSDATCTQYWNQHERTKAVIQGDWIRTGDKYSVDPEGFYWFCGRSDDMLKVSGVWVSPIEIEGVLIEHPAVLEVAVVGREDGDRLVKPHAFIVLRDPRQASPALARVMEEFVTARLAVYKRPRWIDFVPELPKTATGKIQRFKLR